MKASELIEELKKCIEEHGDHEVEIEQDGFSCSTSTVEVQVFTKTWIVFVLY